MASNATPPTRDWKLYGVIVAVMGLLALLILADGRATRAALRAEANRAEQREEAKVRREEAARAERRAEAEATRAERRAEAEATRRYVAEAIARTNELGTVNAIRIDHLNEAIDLSPDSPPSN